jgi:predicted ATP-dependent endonuclease of OLD family
MKLRRISIQNFKSLKNVERENISNFHTFIGRNSLGKSSIFEAILLLKKLRSNLPYSHELISDSISDYESKTILIDLTFDIDHEHRKEYLAHYFNIEEDQLDVILKTNAIKHVRVLISINVYGNNTNQQVRPNQIFITHIELNDSEGYPFPILEENSPGRMRLKNINNNQTTVHIIGGIDNHLKSIRDSNSNISKDLPNESLQKHIVEGIVSSIKSIGAMRESSKKITVNTVENESQVDQRGKNLINLMHTMFTNQNGRYLQVEKFCTRIFPDLETIRPKQLPNNDIILLLKKKNLPFPVNIEHEGTGLDQLLIIIWRIATSEPNTIWLLDEPELHLHPGAEKLLYDFLREEVQRGKQVIVATHSMVFMHKSTFDEITLLLPNEGFAIMATLENLVLAEKESSKTENEIARDVLFNALGYDPAFALEPKSVVMVEGKTDEHIIKIWSKNLGKHVDDKSVMYIPIGNKKKVEQFSPILTYALSGKNAIIILDNDDEDPEDIKNRVLAHAQTFKKNSRIKKDVLRDENFWSYPKEAYSIEHYLLKSKAICKAANNFDNEKEIDQKITDELRKDISEREKPKDFLSNLWESYGFGTYGETETAEKIAEKIEEHELAAHPEIIQLIGQIYD